MGKHAVGAAVTDRLVALRDGIDQVHGEATERARLDAFLDSALDKVDGRYEYSTYCALRILNLPEDDFAGLDLEAIARRRDLALVGLIGDMLSFELAAHDGLTEFLPLMRPSDRLVEKRLCRAVTAIRASLDRLGVLTQGTGVDAARSVVAQLGALAEEPQRRNIELAMLPAYVSHDEYLFLRVLQSFEVNFAWIAGVLRGAVRDMGPNPEAALERLRCSNTFLREAARLFPIIASMQVDAFQDFRRFTEGASAIQSAGYKAVEALCRTPDAERIDSIAYAAVPDVAAGVRSGRPTLDDAYREACSDPAFSSRYAEPIHTEMLAFSQKLLRWREVHYHLARTFLGNRGGTGYTEGVPYLDRVRDIPVFSSVTPDE